MSNDTLKRLAATIRARRTEAADKSYTRQLLDAGPEKCAKKLGEEAVETAIAAVAGHPGIIEGRGGGFSVSSAGASREPRRRVK